MPVIVVAKNYLDDLKSQEQQKSERDRRPVPTYAEIARVAGVTRQSITMFLNRDAHKRVDLNIIDGIITACRNYGHSTKLTDVLRYIRD